MVVLATSLAWSSGSAAADDPAAETTTTTTTSVPPESPPTPAPVPTPTLADVFPGIDPSITPEQLAAFFRFIAGPPVPAPSGAGRRIVYSISGQRVWLVDDAEQVVRTYRVSGRLGLPSIGNHRIFSVSRTSSSGAVSMQYMMRFARGRKLAIGFHSIPVRRDGSPLQTEAQLGTPLSHGCVRQSISDAAFLWSWAGVGTAVVVLG